MIYKKLVSCTLDATISLSRNPTDRSVCLSWVGVPLNFPKSLTLMGVVPFSIISPLGAIFSERERFQTPPKAGSTDPDKKSAFSDHLLLISRTCLLEESESHWRGSRSFATSLITSSLFLIEVFLLTNLLKLCFAL